jgi:hypothetical protein
LGEGEADQAAAPRSGASARGSHGLPPHHSERIPAPEPEEAVVFYDHFPQGFALPASSFMRQFLDHFHL